jgi:threonine aldolase
MGMEAVNLYSDTQTRPTPGMRRAMAEAEVGDEQSGLDPTVLRLEARVAEMLGHEAAVFLPSGTMANAIAFRLHVRPGGDEVVLDLMSHPVQAEAGGPAALSGAMLRPIDAPGGIFGADDLRTALRPERDRYQPRSRLVSVEQTTNLRGGRVWPRATVREVLEVARERGLRTHLDGARLLNAVVASGVPAAEWAGGFDTAWIDFSKGLGAPIGACLAGSEAMVEEAWRYKQMWGGAMRQSGIVAAAALYALDHHVHRMADDHANARALAEGIAEVPGVRLDPDEVETNIVFFEVDDAAGVHARLEAQGVRTSWFGASAIRAVTHLDVDRAGVERAIAAVRAAVARPTPAGR